MPNDFAFCYFIREPLAQCVKIGFAFNVRKRFDTLQASHPFPLAVLGFCPGGQRLERRLHKEFGEDRLNGEWFRSSKALYGRISELCRKKSALTPFIEMRGRNMYFNNLYADHSRRAAAWLAEPPTPGL